MIKIDKNIDDVPESLIPAFPDMFPNRGIPRSSKTTHTRRKELIDNGAYIDEANYNCRYKYKDIKEKLEKIYHGKCAFCEQKVEQLHVEHFRPKKIYYWLAYSWDNLILACPRCNTHKGINFDLNGSKCSFENNEENVRKINKLSENYNLLEQPKMINPENVDPSGHISFTKNGKINSLNHNIQYTITTCQLNRNYLNDERRKILDMFKNEIQSELVSSENAREQRHAIDVLVRQFIKASKEQSNEYIAFRKYSIANNWLNEVIQELI